jgi:hypothetical protein
MADDLKRTANSQLEAYYNSIRISRIDKKMQGNQKGTSSPTMNSPDASQ